MPKRKVTINEPNWRNGTVFIRDNLEILRAMNSACVDLIYLDPPFNSNRNYSAPIGSKAAGAAFKDTWTLSDVDEAWHGEIADRNPPVYEVIDAAGVVHGDSMKSYLIMMAARLIECHRILKPTGSIYLHCDDTAGHYLKLLLDAVFGTKGFKNDLIWSYGGGGRGNKAKAKQFPRNNDNIFFYVKDARVYKHRGIMTPVEHPFGDLPSHIRKDERGYFKTAPRGDYTDVSIARLRSEGRIYETRTGTIRIRYDLESNSRGVLEPKISGSVWNIPDMMHSPKSQRTGYPTQKPRKLLERIIKASSNEGDVVLDPFCGCATTLVAAEALNRKWVGIDISPRAGEIVRDQIGTISSERTELLDVIPFTIRTDVPKRTDAEELPHYSTHKHKLFGKQQGHCNGCQYRLPFHVLSVDHIVPQSKGGDDRYENLQLLCQHCNSTKGQGTQEELLVRLKLSGVSV